jgi:hypothetical protein
MQVSTGGLSPEAQEWQTVRAIDALRDALNYGRDADAKRLMRSIPWESLAEHVEPATELHENALSGRRQSLANLWRLVERELPISLDGGRERCLKAIGDHDGARRSFGLHLLEESSSVLWRDGGSSATDETLELVARALRDSKGSEGRWKIASLASRAAASLRLDLVELLAAEGAGQWMSLAHKTRALDGWSKTLENEADWAQKAEAAKERAKKVLEAMLRHGWTSADLIAGQISESLWGIKDELSAPIAEGLEILGETLLALAPDRPEWGDWAIGARRMRERQEAKDYGLWRWEGCDRLFGAIEERAALAEQARMAKELVATDPARETTQAASETRARGARL